MVTERKFGCTHGIDDRGEARLFESLRRLLLGVGQLLTIQEHAVDVDFPVADKRQ